MIYAKIGNQEARKRLEDALKASEKKGWFIRLRVIELSAQKHTVQELSKLFGLCQETIRNYIHAYNRGGLEALAPRKSPGRPPRMGDWVKARWDQVMKRPPHQYEKLNTQSSKWTLEQLRTYLQKYHHVDASLSSVHRSLKRKTSRRMYG